MQPKNQENRDRDRNDPSAASRKPQLDEKPKSRPGLRGEDKKQDDLRDAHTKEDRWLSFSYEHFH